MIIRVDGTVKRYKDVTALNGVSFEVVKRTNRFHHVHKFKRLYRVLPECTSYTEKDLKPTE